MQRQPFFDRHNQSKPKIQNQAPSCPQFALQSPDRPRSTAGRLTETVQAPLRTFFGPSPSVCLGANPPYFCNMKQVPPKCSRLSAFVNNGTWLQSPRSLMRINSPPKTSPRSSRWEYIPINDGRSYPLLSGAPIRLRACICSGDTRG